MSAFTPAQRHRAIGLYKRLLRTSQQTFVNDEATMQAWRLEVRRKFDEAARTSTESAAIEQGLKEWDEVVDVLRRNVVQGKLNDASNAYKLRLTKDTELGNNEDDYKKKKKQWDDLAASSSKGSTSQRVMCGGAAASSASTPTAAGTRGYHTSARVLKEAERHFPRPVPHFPQTTILADGSSITLTTTSPRSSLRLTRDPTNHPLWNPGTERRGAGGEEEDESGRLGRFRRRFGGAMEAEESADGSSSKMAEKSNTFGEKDFDWMSVGGREARAGKALAPKKGAKGKGKK